MNIKELKGGLMQNTKNINHFKWISLSSDFFDQYFQSCALTGGYFIASQKKLEIINNDQKLIKINKTNN